MRNARAVQIGRIFMVLLAVTLLSAPLAAAASSARADGWTRVRPQASKASRGSAWHLVSIKRKAKEQPRGSAGGRTGTGKSKPRTPFDRAGFSIGGHFHNESTAEMTSDLDAMKTAGARWVRIDINWAVIQAGGSTSYNWGPFDRVVSGATSRGFSVLAELLYTPGWARPSGTTPETPPTNLDDYARFVKAAVGRYAPLGVHAFEIWNEPNNASFWRPKADVARYTAMLRSAYPAIKSADPTAVVVSGGLSPAVDDGRNISPVSFLRGIYANGGRGSFDALGHHPYTHPAAPGEAQPWSPWYQMYGTSPSLRSLMTDHGDAGKQIWATEVGVATNGPSGTHVDEQTQAAMLTRAFDLYRTYSWAGPMFWYSARDLGTAADTRENFYGVLRHDSSAKPALAAYAAVTGGA